MGRQKTQKELEKLIIKYQDAYYNGEPLISDAEFDELWDELKKRFPDSEVLNDIGSDNNNGFPKIKHDITMGSQNKATTAEEMAKFFKKNGKEYICQYKCDGISIVLNYKNGKLISAATRGDGYTGSQITNNALKMKGVLKTIEDKTFTGSVRGEIQLFRKDKNKYFPDMKNCRNAASGIAKHLDGQDCDKLTVITYDAQYKGNRSFGTQENLQEWLSEQGFNVADYRVIKNADPDKAIALIDAVFAKFDKLKYDIDGLVWKKNKINLSDMQKNRPDEQIALKPAKIEKITKLLDINWQMVNGSLNPVGIVEPVELHGTTVKQASLCNINELERLGIEIGDDVVIVKSGMIIPKIIRKA